MSMFINIVYFFSDYLNSEERSIGRFFKKANEKNSKLKISKKLNLLMQKNIVTLTLFNERRYKGYDYLTKKNRKKLYQNTELIKQNFHNYLLNRQYVNPEIVFEHIKNVGVNVDKLEQCTDKLIYLYSIMDYLSPKNGLYKYRPSSSFGELLKDPSTDQLTGDCNQIVTLYIFLYSLRYDITDLQLKTPPGHVCLHFFGVDIEATNSTFMNYQQTEPKILAIQEIVTINLLDVTDTYFKTHKISPEYFLESARLAFLLSSERELVKANLAIAYKNVVIDLAKNNNYISALKYAKQSGSNELLNYVGNNGAVYFMSNNAYGDAINLAHYANASKELLESIYGNRGVWYLKNGKYNNAISDFKTIKNSTLLKQCYIGLYLQEQKKLGKISTVNDIKNKKSVVRNMQMYANKSGDKSLIEYTSSLAKM